jgi:perosamine synthetase
LAKIDEILKQKRRVAQSYHRRLASVRGLQLPVEKSWATNVYWMFGIVVTPQFGISRDALVAELAEDGVETRTFFCPMNQQPCLQKAGRAMPQCPVADQLWDRGLYLPSSLDLSEQTIELVCDRVAHAARRDRRRAA